MTRIVHVKLFPFDVYIGRSHKDFPNGSKWGNPFIAGKHGTIWEVLTQYKQHILSSPELLKSLPELENKIMGCWCKVANDPFRPCHGDVLIEILKEFAINFEP